MVSIKQTSLGIGERGTGANRRPSNVESLLYNGNAHPTWALANRQKARFYVINLEPVLSRILLPRTSVASKQFFDEAKRVIASETAWFMQHLFEYECSHTQIFPDKIKAPKYFGHAATLIVAMELAARKRVPDYNVYDHLRILPAQFFVDGFDATRLDKLKAYHAQMKPAERMREFGADFAEKSFLETCCTKIDQKDRVELLSQIADGHCVTRQTADLLCGFVNAHYPLELRVGPVRSSGEEADSQGLGSKGAAPRLKVPREVNEKELPPCS